MSESIQAKLYEPCHLNSLLLADMKRASNQFETVYITGDINSFYKFKISGCSFKVSLNNESFRCKVWWETSVFTPDKVENFVNTRCIVGGIIKAENFQSRHGFYLEVKSIDILHNDTKLEKLKEICNQKGYFIGKKTIDYDKITKISIISKLNTQGYDDFVNQFKVPINIELKQITLEGERTSQECIKAIDNSQESGLIAIVRGGGDTSEISNSFDTEELFKAIKDSKVPVVTAIGHEQDKDDKLLITCVSDLNSHTPTALAKFLNSKLYEHLLNKIDIEIEKNEQQFRTNINVQINNEFKILEKYTDVLINKKFGGPIVEISNENTKIVIKMGEKYYIHTISLNNEIQISNSDLKIKEQLLTSVKEKNIKLFEKSLKKFNRIDEEVEEYVRNSIDKLHKLNRIDDEFSESIGDKNLLYCTLLKPVRKLTKFVQNRQILLYYKNVIFNSLNGDDVPDINQIYKHIYTQF